MVTLIFAGSTTTLDSLSFDAAPQDTHSADADATEHPVESGGAVVDHVVQKPEVLKVEGLVSDTPIGGEVEEGRAALAWATLSRLKDTATLLSIDTPKRQYDRMILKSLDVVNDARTGDAIRFQATFRQIRTAETRRAAPRPTGARQDKGKRAAKKAEPATEEKGKTLLKGFSNWLTGS